MKIVIVESKDEDSSALSEYCQVFYFVRDVFRFKCLHDALLFLSSNPVDVLILNLETPYAFDILCDKGNLRLDGPFLILTAANLHLFDKVQENEKIFVQLHKPVSKLQLIEVLVQAKKEHAFL